MADTSGVILPSFYSSEAELKAELKRRDEEAGYTPFNPEDFAHSSTEDRAKDFIEHHGIKGQKWGIRNDKGHEGKQASRRKIGKLDKKFEKRMLTPTTTIKLHNRAVELTNKNDIHRINTKPEYAHQDFRRDSPIRQKYYKEHQRAFLDNIEKAAKEMGTNASGTKKYSIVETPNGGWDVILDDVKHADNNVEAKVKVNLDEKGHIVSIEVVDPIEHTGLVVKDFIEHHGVKGQKWGIRNLKNRVTTSKKTSSDYKKTLPYRGKKASQLTNKQLREVTSRIDMERKYNQIHQSHRYATGKKLVNEAVWGLATAGTVYAFLQSPLGKMAVASGEKFVKGKVAK